MFRSFSFKLIFLLSLLVITSQNIAFSDVVSLESDYVAGQANITDKLNDDRHDLTDGVNNIRGVYAGSVQSSGQIKADTVGEENMADDANPRIRTAEGAACNDLVYSGLLPTTSSSLVLSIPSGTAYPDGYRVEKTTTTAATLTASKWTYYYILTSGSFDTNVTTIGASTPTAPANSALLFRASTDSTTINTVTDLRKSSCAAGPFSAISDASGEASLGDLFAYGTRVRRFSPAGRTPQGFAEGAIVSWNTATTFKVTPGALYINGKYRYVSTDITVTTAADSPSTGGSGIDTGSIAGSTTYSVYGVADQDSVNSYSISFSTSASAPSGVTNSRYLGQIKTDATSLFTSRDNITVHSVNDREVLGAACTIDPSATLLFGYNISGTVDNGAGDWTCTIDNDFNNANYTAIGTCDNVADAGEFATVAVAAGSVRFVCKSNVTNNPTDTAARSSMVAFGDAKR